MLKPFFLPYFQSLKLVSRCNWEFSDMLKSSVRLRRGPVVAAAAPTRPERPARGHSALRPRGAPAVCRPHCVLQDRVSRRGRPRYQASRRFRLSPAGLLCPLLNAATFTQSSPHCPCAPIPSLSPSSVPSVPSPSPPLCPTVPSLSLPLRPPSVPSSPERDTPGTLTFNTVASLSRENILNRC